MSVTRGKFLKALGKSIPGVVLRGGVATAAKTLLDKVAAASGSPPVSAPAPGEPGEAAKVDFITSGPTDGNRIALTFDDGPTPGVTELILDELKRHKLHATFFMIGQRIAVALDLARRVLAEGHEIGNHTFTHPKLTTLADPQVKDEIHKTRDIMDGMLNYRAAWFRPPYGAFHPNQTHFLKKAGLRPRPVLWSVDPRDWSQPGEAKIVAAVLAETKPGSIVICHDLYPQTANGLGPILEGLRERGFSPGTLSTLLNSA